MVLDVARAFHWDACRGWSPAVRESRVAALTRVLDGVFPAALQRSFPFYVQGCHDVAGVLLLMLGEAAAGAALARLVRAPLGGLLQEDMAAPVALLRLLPRLLEHANGVWGEGRGGGGERGLRGGELGSGRSSRKRGGDPSGTPAADAEGDAAAPHSDDDASRAGDAVLRLLRAGAAPLPPFALPWVLTWFSHPISSLGVVARLFDAFALAHPLLPVYLSAVLVAAPASARALRAVAAAHPGDEGELFRALSQLPEAALRDTRAADDALRAAAALYARCPPRALLAVGHAGGDDHIELLRNRWPQLWDWAPPGGAEDALLRLVVLSEPPQRSAGHVVLCGRAARVVGWCGVRGALAAIVVAALAVIAGLWLQRFGGAPAS